MRREANIKSIPGGTGKYAYPWSSSRANAGKRTCTRYPRFFAITGIFLLVLLFMGGCAASDNGGRRAILQYVRGDYAAAADTLRPLAKETNENFVLNNVRLGSSALARYDLDEAESAFLAAYEVLNSVGTNDGGRTAGAILVDEKLRIWRGEPYERAMANFYLGLIYYMRGDYANARGAFENSLFKLRDYGQGNDAPKEDAYQQVESNFALGQIMLAKSWQRMNEPQKADAAFARARSLRPDLATIADPARNAASNVLLVVDFGYAPRKVTDFDGAIVGFGPTPAEAGPVPPPVVVVDGRVQVPPGAIAPPVDTLVLAQDRRWQSLDTWRTVKSAVGTGLIVAGAYEGMRSNNRNNQLAGLAMVGAGLLLKATSQADIRQWEMLPRTTFIIPMTLPPGTHDVTVDFANSSGLSQTWRGIVAPAKGEAVYYVRTQRWTPGPYVWPPPTMRGAPMAAAN